MENLEVKQEIKNSDDGKGILITNDAIEQISNLLKGQSDKKALRVGVRSGGCSGMSYTMDFIGTDEINPDDKVYDYSLKACLLYTSPSPRDMRRSRMPSSA